MILIYKSFVPQQMKTFLGIFLIVYYGLFKSTKDTAS